MILLVGSFPPPVGGVSIHCQRLYLALGELGFNLKFLQARSILSNLQSFLRFRSRANVIHIHVSSSFALSLYVFAALLLTRAEVLITIHSNYIRSRSIIEQILLDLSIAYSHRVIVLNQDSYNQVLKLNEATILSTSFIPYNIPERGSQGYLGLSYFCLSNDSKSTASLSQPFINEYSKVVSTTAWKLVYDNDLELYGVSDIIDLSKSFPSVLFVVSDPSREHLDLAERRSLFYQNVIYIVEPHRFVDVLSFSDLFIRNTTTDGDSISIRESLYMGVPVAASASVDRPIGCISYAKLSSNLLAHILFGDECLEQTPVKPEGRTCLPSATLCPGETNILDHYQATYASSLWIPQ